MAVLQRTKASAISALVGVAAAVALSMSAPAGAQQKAPAAGKGEQFFPVLVYRTGAYAPNGVPWANGYVDYLKLVNAQAESTASRSRSRVCSATRPIAASEC
jgi:hypothetical protein